jgi:hypothetical protein
MYCLSSTLKRTGNTLEDRQCIGGQTIHCRGQTRHWRTDILSVLQCIVCPLQCIVCPSMYCLSSTMYCLSFNVLSVLEYIGQTRHWRTDNTLKRTDNTFEDRQYIEGQTIH